MPCEETSTKIPKLPIQRQAQHEASSAEGLVEEADSWLDWEDRLEVGYLIDRRSRQVEGLGEPIGH